MSAGELHHRVTLQNPPSASTSLNVHGEPTASWSTVSTMWAKVVLKSGGEVIIGDQLRSTQGATVKIRARSTLNPTQRFVWSDGWAQKTWNLYLRTLIESDDEFHTWDCVTDGH